MDAQLTGSLSMVVQDSAIAVLLEAHAPHSMPSASALLRTTVRYDGRIAAFPLRPACQTPFRAALMQSDGCISDTGYSSLESTNDAPAECAS